MSNLERRSLTAEIQANDEGKFTGLAAVFDKPSQDLGGFIEYIDKRAFDGVLADSPDVVAVWNHNENDLLGRTSSGTLRLWTTDEGLHYELDTPDTTLGRDLRALAARGDVTGSSFAFTVNEDAWEKRDGKKVRRVLSIDRLFDVSLVSTPAYPDASVALRSLQQFEEQLVAASRAAGPADASLQQTDSPKIHQGESRREPGLAYLRSIASSKAAAARALAELTRTSRE